jgi:hypothetical protein
VHPIAQNLTHKVWNPPNPSRHKIWAKRRRLEPLNRPRNKRRPQGRHWATSWSQKSAGDAAHRRPCLEEGSHCREPSWSHSPPRFAPSMDPIDPCVILPQKPHVTVPRRAREQSSGEPPMAPPHQACAPPLSAEFDVSRPLVDGGPGLDRRYPYI